MSEHGQEWRKFSVSVVTADDEQLLQKVDALFAQFTALLKANKVSGVVFSNEAISGHRNTAWHGRTGD